MKKRRKQPNRAWLSPSPTPRGVENAIKDAAKRAAAADPSLDVNKRIQLE